MKNNLKKIDFLLLVSSVICMIVGVVAIYSASTVLTVLSQGVPSNYYLKRQVIIIIASIVVSFIGLYICRAYKSKKLIYLYLLLCLGLLIGVHYYGKEVNGSMSWYDLGGFSFQPSEFIKPALIMFMAYFYERMIKIKESRWWVYLIPLIVAIVIAFIIFKQPDLGGAIIIILIAGLIFISLPINKYAKRKCYLAIGIVGFLGILVLLFAGNKFISEYQMKRLNFWAPCTRYMEDTGYQVCNSFIAIKNGGISGLGFGNSTQKYLYLPEAHTDFIFPIIVEEIGLIGGIVVLLLYLIMLYAILRIAKKTHRISDSIIVYGTFIYLSVHILINLLGVSALMPLTGVPLPLLSYGGSFNFNVIMLLVLCQCIAIDSKNAKIKEQIRNLK